MIYETDTDTVRVWNGSTWQAIGGTPAGSLFNYTAGTSINTGGTALTNVYTTMGQIVITPTSTSDKVVLFINYGFTTSGYFDGSWYIAHRIQRASTTIWQDEQYLNLMETMNYSPIMDNGCKLQYRHIYVDSPSTTSSVTDSIGMAAPYYNMGFNGYAASSPALPNIYGFLIKG